MKKLLLVLVIPTALLFASCNKSNGTFPSLSGTWNIVSDSTYFSGIGPNSPPSGRDYIGTSGDHFIFTGNKLYIKEGTIKIDTAIYTVSQGLLNLTYTYLNDGGTIIYNSIGSYTIARNDGKNLELTEFLASPGGLFKEDIKLKR
jgi:hypothetical protein